MRSPIPILPQVHQPHEEAIEGHLTQENQELGEAFVQVRSPIPLVQSLHASVVWDFLMDILEGTTPLV
jgi:hypothetical protein